MTEIMGSDCSENEDDQVQVEDEEMFYAWECVSLIRQSGATLDLVIPHIPDLMSLIHVVYMQIYEPTDNSFMHIFRILKFRMKLSYEAWMNRIKVIALIRRAIYKTLIQ